MAEVHIIGKVIGGSGFGSRKGFFCKWNLKTGPGWKVEEGLTEGQTQVNYCDDISSNDVWCHPIDIHLSCKSIQGWPQILFQVYSQDAYNRVDLCGYGVLQLPMRPGNHVMKCHTWRPFGSLLDEFRKSLVGGGPQLVSNDLIGSNSERYRLKTIPSGIVDVKVGLIFRNFKNYGLVVGEDTINITFTLDGNNASYPAQDDNDTNISLETTTQVLIANALELADETSYKINQCLCDRKQLVCDINCCCDILCSDDEKKTFNESCDQMIDRRTHDTYCIGDGMLKSHNTHYAIHQISDLLCIVTDNLKKSTTYDHVGISKSQEDFSKNLRRNPALPGNPNLHNIPEALQKYGYPVWVLVKNVGIKTFELPFALNDDECNSKYFVRYLLDLTIQCKTHRKHSTRNLNISHILNYQFLGQINEPKTDNENASKNITTTANESSDLNFLGSTFNLLTPIVVQCSDGSNSCTEVNLNADTDVGKVNLIFYHNASKGLDRVEIRLHEHSTQMTQEIKVSFVNVNDEENDSSAVGTSGYSVGSAIVFGTLQLQESNDTLYTRTINRTKSFMIPIHGTSSSCLSALPITFGEDISTTCFMEVSAADFKEGCYHLQQRIFRLFLQEDDEWFAAMFMNVEQQELLMWVPLLTNIIEEFNADYQNGGWTCRTIQNDFILLITYAFQGNSLFPQAKIVGMNLQTTSRRFNLLQEEFFASDSSKHVPVTTKVMFIDITKPVAIHLPKTPEISFQLPYDFFYPFLLSSSTSYKQSDYFWISFVIYTFIIK